MKLVPETPQMPPKKSQPKVKSTKVANTPPCYQCGENASLAISQSDKNPNRPYFFCQSGACKTEKGSKFLGWFDEYKGEKPEFKKKEFSQKPQKHWEDEETEEEESEEEESPQPKKRKRSPLHTASDRIPSITPRDALTMDRILSTDDNVQRVLQSQKELNEKIDRLISLFEAANKNYSSGP